MRREMISLKRPLFWVLEPTEFLSKGDAWCFKLAIVWGNRLCVFDDVV